MTTKSNAAPMEDGALNTSATDSISNAAQPEQAAGTVEPTLPPIQPEEQHLIALAKLADRIRSGEIHQRGTEVETALNEIKEQAKPTKLTLKGLENSLKHLLGTGQTSNQQQAEEYTPDEQTAAGELLKQPDLFAEFHKDFKLTDYLADNKLTTAGLLFLGRTLLPTSSTQYNFGKSSGGKSEFTLATASFFSQSRFVNLTDITPRYLYRRGGEDGKALQYCIVVFGEMSPPNPKDPGADSIKQAAMRQLNTENVLTLGTVDDAPGQRNVAIDRKLYGPVTMVFTGTKSPSSWNDETMNRTYAWNFKHTHDTIKKVLISKAIKGTISSNPFAVDTGELAQAQRKWQAAFSLLKRLDANDTTQFNGIEIPFLEKLIFSKTRLTEPEMRAFDMLKHCIAVSTLLHQKERETREDKGKTVLIATLEDYTKIKDAYLEMVPRTTQGLSNDLIEIFTSKLLPAWTDGKAKSQAEIAALLAVPPSTAKGYIYAWDDADLLDVDDTLTSVNKRTAKKYYRLSDGYNARTEAILARGELGINIAVLAPAETSSTSESDSQILGTPGLYDSTTTGINEGQQRLDDGNQPTLVEPSTVLGENSHRQAVKSTGETFQDSNSDSSTRYGGHTHSDDMLAETCQLCNGAGLPGGCQICGTVQAA